MPGRTLTPDDIQAIVQAMQAHNCRFQDISNNDMAFLKDLVSICKETRSEVIRWMIKGVIYIALLVAGVYAFMRYGGKG